MEAGLAVILKALHAATEDCLTLLGLSMSESVRIKEAKTKTFMDGLGHRGSERPTEREMRLFMSIHDQCAHAMFGVFSLDQQLINQTEAQ